MALKKMLSGFGAIFTTKQTNQDKSQNLHTKKQNKKQFLFVFWHLNHDLMYKITGIYRLLLKTIKRYNKGNAKRGISPRLKI